MLNSKLKPKKIVYIIIILILVFIVNSIIKNNFIKDSFKFTHNNIVRTHLYKKDRSGYIYDYKISKEDANLLSKELISSKLKKSSAKNSPNPYLGSVVIFLDGRTIEYEGDIEIQYKRNIILVKIDEEQAYVMLEVKKPNGNQIKLQEFYTIKSKKLVDCIDSLYMK